MPFGADLIVGSASTGSVVGSLLCCVRRPASARPGGTGARGGAAPTGIGHAGTSMPAVGAPADSRLPTVGKRLKSVLRPSPNSQAGQGVYILRGLIGRSDAGPRRRS